MTTNRWTMRHSLSRTIEEAEEKAKRPPLRKRNPWKFEGYQRVHEENKGLRERGLLPPVQECVDRKVARALLHRGGSHKKVSLPKVVLND